MARVKVDITGKLLATIRLPVRITDINYGNHAGNDSIVGLLHESRVQWLRQHDFSEMNMNGTSLILAGLCVEYVNESFYGDELIIQIFAGQISAAGFELLYHIQCERNGKTITICKAKTDMVSYDYNLKKVKALPEGAIEILH